jgi:hypothetical protein
MADPLEGAWLLLRKREEEPAEEFFGDEFDDSGR